MRVWIDLANSPHVATFEPVVERLRERGAEVLLTARDHAQTADLARRSFGEVHIVGGESPAGRARKLISVVERSRRLLGTARASRPAVALSHGSYAQLLAARAARVPGVTMMDYEYQPANHLSFRLAQRVVVPVVFPDAALKRFGAGAHKVRRYEGFKEELYLGRFEPSGAVLDELGLDRDRVIVVLRPPPEGALYHRMSNEHFEGILSDAAQASGVQVVVLPRGETQGRRYRARPGVIVPERAVDGRSLLYHADLMIGAGGTMNREAALLGTPTYTVFAGRLAAVDAELIRQGLLRDLRLPGTSVQLTKKRAGDRSVARDRAERILVVVIDAIADALR